MALDAPVSGRKRRARCGASLLWAAILLIASAVYGVFDGAHVDRVATALLLALLCLAYRWFAM
jgi:hypothetical protein